VAFFKCSRVLVIIDIAVRLLLVIFIHHYRVCNDKLTKYSWKKKNSIK